MSFGLKKSLGRICKTESFKLLYETGVRPRTFSETVLQLISEREEKVGYTHYEKASIVIANPRAIVRICRGGKNVSS